MQQRFQKGLGGGGITTSVSTEVVGGADRVVVILAAPFELYGMTWQQASKFSSKNKIKPPL